MYILDINLSENFSGRCFILSIIFKEVCRDPYSPSVLEPDLDLGLGELELVGELGSLGDGEVLLLPELLL